MTKVLLGWFKGGGYKTILLITAFLVLATVAASRFSPWHDESYSVLLIERSYSGIIEATANDVHPPLYYIVLKSWSEVAGSSLLALRMSSIVFMLAAVLVIWRTLGSHGLLQKRPNIILAFMLFGAFSLRFAFELRNYALGALLVAVSFWLIMKIIALQKPRPLLGVILGLLFAAALYVHYFLLLFIVATLIYMLWHSGVRNVFSIEYYKSHKGAPMATMLIAYALASLLFLLWLPTAYEQFRLVKDGGFWIGPMTVPTILSMLSYSFVFIHQWMASGWWAVALTLFLIALLAIFVQSFVYLKKSEAGKFAICAVLVPLVLLIIISLPPLRPAFQDRYLSFYSAFLYAAVGIAIVRIAAKKITFKRMVLPVVVMIGMFVGIFGVMIQGNNLGYSPNPYFVANTITRDVQTASEKEPVIVVSNDLWYYMDLHVTLRGTGTPVYMYVPAENELYKYGNYSALIGRDELIIRSADELTAGATIWFVHGTTDGDIPNNPFASLSAERSNVYGYSTITQYQM